MFNCPGCKSPLSLEEVQSKLCTLCNATWQGELAAQAPGSSSGPSQTLDASGFEQRVSSPTEKQKSQPTDDTVDFAHTPLSENSDLPGQPEVPPEKDAVQESDSEIDALSTIDIQHATTDDVPLAGFLQTYWQDSSSQTSTPTVTLQSKSAEVPREFMGSTPVRTLKTKGATDSSSDADYDIIGYSAEGSMGKVFVARQNSIQRIVAIKQLKEDLAAKEKHRKKFLAEAAVTGELDHPNIVPVHDLGVSQDGKLFYSMKMIRGQSWQEGLTKKSRPENLDILLRVADAVAYAHSKNIIHRDLKPENIMLGSFGEVLVADWGVAVRLDLDTDFGLAGTPAYMAPEMASGPPELLGKHSDIYLLGAMLFELVVGLAPHHLSNNTSDVLIRAAANEIVATDIEDELLVIANRAMATKPRNRYATVEQFQEAVRAYQTHTESLAILGRAETELSTALASKNPESFSRALFGFQNAIDIWSGNNRAYAGLREAKMAYAQNALESENYELGISLLDAEDERDHSLLKKLEQGKQERDQRARRLKFAKRTAVGLLGTLAVVLATFGYTLNSKNQELTKKEEKITANNTSIESQRQELGKITQEIEDKEVELVQKDNELITKQDDLTKAEGNLEDTNIKLGDAKRDLEKKKGELEKETERAIAGEGLAAERLESAILGQFISEIALIKSRISENEVTRPLSQLADLKAKPLNSELEEFNSLRDYCDWEWDRLQFLCHPNTKTLSEGEPSELFSAVTASQDGKLIVTATLTEDGTKLQLKQNDPGGQIRQIQAIDLPGISVRSLALSKALSENRRLLAVGGGKTAGMRREDPLVVVYRVLPEALEEEWRISAGEYGKESGNRRISQGYIRNVDFHPGNKEWLLTAGNGPNAILFQREAAGAWSAIEKLPHWGAFQDARFAPDGSALVTVDRSTKYPKRQGIHVWPIGNGTVNKSGRKDYFGDFITAAFSPSDSSTVACAARDGGIRLWRWNSDASSDPTPEVLETPSPVHSIAFSSSGEKLALASEDRLIQVWESGAIQNKTAAMPESGSIDWIRNSRLPSLRGHGDSVISCQFLGGAEAPSLLSLDSSGDSRLWNLDDYYDEMLISHSRLKNEAKRNHCTAACFSADGSLLATVGADGHARLWQGPTAADAGQKISLGEGKAIYVGHPRNDNARFFAAPVGLPGGTGMAIATFSSQLPVKDQRNEDASLCLWEISKGRSVLQQKTNRAEYMATSQKHPIALLGRPTSKPSLELWGFDQGETFSSRLVNRRTEPAVTAAIHPSSPHVFLSLGYQKGRLLPSFNTSQGGGATFDNMPRDMTNSTFTADGKWLLTTQEGTNRLLVSSATTGERVKQKNEAPWEGVPFRVAVSGSADSARATVVSHPKNELIGDENSTVTFLSTQGGKFTKLGELVGPYLDASPTPDGQSVFAIKNKAKGGVELIEWQHESGKSAAHAKSKEIAQTNPSHLQFLKNRQLLTSGTNRYGRQTAHLWDLEKNVELARMTSGSKVMAVRFSEDHQQLITVCRNGVIYVWDISNLQLPVLERQLFAQGLLDLRQAAISKDAQWVTLLGSRGNAAVIHLASGQVKPVRRKGLLAVGVDCSQSDVAILFNDNRIWTRRAGADGIWIPGQLAASNRQSPLKSRRVRLAADGEALAAQIGNRLHLWRRDKQGQWQGPLTSAKRNAKDLDTAICFSKSNSRLISGNKNGSLTVWQILWQSMAKDSTLSQSKSLRELFSWRGDPSTHSILSLDFSADGKNLVSTSASGSATIWPSLPETARSPLLEASGPLFPGSSPLAEVGSSQGSASK